MNYNEWRINCSSQSELRKSGIHFVFPFDFSHNLQTMSISWGFRIPFVFLFDFSKNWQNVSYSEFFGTSYVFHFDVY